MIIVVERETAVEYTAKQIEGGYEIYNGTELYKKVRESTFKRYFKITGEATTEASPSPKKEATPEPVEVSAEKRQQIIDKIKKLLALSENNPSQEEAISATLMAQKLMAKYRIQEDETLEEIKEEEISSIITQQKHNSTLHAWRKQLAVIVARNFCCKCYMKGQDVVFRGYKQDAEIANNAFIYLYTIGDRLGDKLYNEQLKLTGSGKGVYNSFVMGFLKGVDEGLSVQCTALMLIIPQAVEDEWKTFAAGFKHGSTKSIEVADASLYNKGKEEGKNAVKARQLEGKR